MGEAIAASFVGSLTSNPSLPLPLEARTEERSHRHQASCHQRRSSPPQSPSEAAVTCLAIAVDFAGRRCVERKAVGQARDRRGGESCHRICCRLSSITIMELRGGRHRCELAEGERGAVEELELDSFGLSIMPSSLVSTYSLLVEDVLEVVFDAVVVRKATASRIQRLAKLPCILGVNLNDVNLLEFLLQFADTDGSSTMPPSVIRVLNLIV
ncbi:hypothetical protein AHAS_Ahas19G0156100 [Arachis hypogaea]